MEDKLNEMATQLTEELMSFMFGDRFDSTEDMDDEMSKAYEYINEKTFGMIWNAYDEGANDAYEEMEE